MKNVYKVVLHGGFVGLIGADSLEQARRTANLEQGLTNVSSVSMATEQDIEWVMALGGKVPKLLPSEWAREGYFCIQGGWKPKVGDPCDYYDHDGNKRQGIVKAYDDKAIVIEGERKTIVTETFKVRFGR